MKKRINLIALLIGTFCILFLFVGCDMIQSLDGQIFYDNDDWDIITGTGYENGAYFIVPDDYDKCQGANVDIRAHNQSDSTLILALRLSSSSDDEYYDMLLTLQPGDMIDSTYLIRLNDVSGGTNLRLWLTDPTSEEVATAIANEELSLSGDIMYWLFNVVSVN